MSTRVLSTTPPNKTLEHLADSLTRAPPPTSRMPVACSHLLRASSTQVASVGTRGTSIRAPRKLRCETEVAQAQEHHTHTRWLKVCQESRGAFSSNLLPLTRPGIPTMASNLRLCLGSVAKGRGLAR